MAPTDADLLGLARRIVATGTGAASTNAATLAATSVGAAMHVIGANGSYARSAAAGN